MSEPTGAPSVDAPRRPIRWGWWVGGGVALAVLALMSGAVALGWWAANQTLIAAQQNVVDEPAAGPVIAWETSMPDVRGLTRDEAAQVFADTGFAASIVTFEEAPSGLPEGTVVTQSPVFGTPSPTEIVVGVAVPTTMPAITGMDRQAAVSALADLGVAAAVVFQYDATAAAGTVLTTVPATGETLGDTATVTLATTGSSIALGDLRRLTGTCRSTGEVALRGIEYPSAVSCGADSEARTTTWSLGAQGDLFTATVGIDDDAAPGTSATVEILADGIVIDSEQFAFGKPVNISVAVSGVIQLSARVSAPTEVTVVLARASVAGSDEAIAELSR